MDDYTAPQSLGSQGCGTPIAAHMGHPDPRVHIPIRMFRFVEERFVRLEVEKDRLEYLGD
jgi:hypothetical protein